MHRWRLETPLREKNPGSQFTRSVNRVGSAAFEPSGNLRVVYIETLQPTDPPR